MICTWSKCVKTINSELFDGCKGQYLTTKVAVWCSGNALVLLNAVALHRARLVWDG